MKKVFYVSMIALGFACSNTSKNNPQTPVQNGIPEGFVYLDEHIPGLKTEARYYSSNNFVGQQVDGYESNRIILSLPAADSLAEIQKELQKEGLELKVFDAYRPQRAVDHFVRWAKDLTDTITKATYYPEVDKSQLFAKGYIAAKSGHTRGSTCDLTLINSNTQQELDMGTSFDFFSPKSWPTDTTVTQQQFDNRMKLQRVMENHSFKHLPEEWWHFTLENEPYPDTYFDFVVK